MKKRSSPRASPSFTVPAFLFLSISILIFMHCSKSTQNNAPVISEVVVPDSLIAGYSGGFFSVKVSDPQGSGDIAWVFLEIGAPNSNWNPGVIYLRDDGTGGDFTASDGTYSLLLSSPPDSTNPGEYDFSFKAKDKDGAESNQIVEKVRIAGNEPPQLSNLVAPDSLEAGKDSAFFSVMVTDPEGLVDIAAVYLDIEHPTSPWDPDTTSLFDDGTHGDTVADDGIYSVLLDPPPEYALNGDYEYIFRAKDIKGKTSAALTKVIKVIGNRAPALSNLVAPDSLTVERDSAFFSVQASDPNGLSDIEAVYLHIEHPTSPWKPDTLLLFDDGSHGDSVSADGTYSLFLSPPPRHALDGYYEYVFWAEDKWGLVSDELTKTIRIFGNRAPTLTNLIVPDSIIASGASVFFSVDVLDPDGDSISAVFMDIEHPLSIWGADSIPLYDDGTNGDVTPNDGTYSLLMSAPPDSALTGLYTLCFKAVDSLEAVGQLETQVKIIGNYPPTLSELSAPDTLQRTNDTADTWLASVLVTDDQGLSGIDKAWFYVIKPDGSPGSSFDLYDDGTHGDSTAADERYSLEMQKPNLSNQTGDYRFIFKARDIYEAVSDSLLHYIHVK